jgi:sulfur-carrier protein
MSLNCCKKPIGLPKKRKAEPGALIVYSAPHAHTGSDVSVDLLRIEMVSVQIFGQILCAAVDESECEIAVTGPSTVKQLIEANHAQLGALLQYITSREALITINKKIGSEDSQVRDGDHIKISYQSRTSYDGTRDIPT